MPPDALLSRNPHANPRPAPRIARCAGASPAADRHRSRPTRSGPVAVRLLSRGRLAPSRLAGALSVADRCGGWGLRTGTPVRPVTERSPGWVNGESRRPRTGIRLGRLGEPLIGERGEAGGIVRGQVVSRRDRWVRRERRCRHPTRRVERADPSAVVGNLEPCDFLADVLSRPPGPVVPLAHPIGRRGQPTLDRCLVESHRAFKMSGGSGRLASADAPRQEESFDAFKGSDRGDRRVHPAV